MLINFGIKNMTSFKDMAILSLAAYSRLSRHKNSVMDLEGQKVLKSVVLYGPNASGKSNILQSLQIFRRFVLGKQNTESPLFQKTYYPFALSTETEHSPTDVFIEFYIEDIKNFFRYEIVFTDKEIVSEILKQQIDKKEVILFKRKLDKLEEVSPKYFQEGVRIKQLKVLDKIVPLISVSGFLNGPLSKKILNFFKNIKFKSYGNGGVILDSRIKDASYRQQLASLLKRADLGISDLLYKEVSFNEIQHKYLLPQFEHYIYNKEHKKVRKTTFVDGKESTGTLEYLHFLLVSLDIFKSGGVLVVDELDSSLHPLLVEEIINLFNSSHNTKAQLIFSAHNTAFLSQRLFRKDQVYFVEKNKYGESSLFSLLDYKQDAREDVNWENRYLAGLYGAVPSLKSLEEMCGE